MQERYLLQPLAEQHLSLRVAFSSGEKALDRYLRERARKEMEQRIAAVWVSHDRQEDRIAGYYTLNAVVIERGDLPRDLTHRMARSVVYPATLIGRLAIDRGYRGERIGGRLLLDALARSLAASRQVASIAVITGAKTPEAQTFYEHYGFVLLPAERHERRLFLPIRRIETLFFGRRSPP